MYTIYGEEQPYLLPHLHDHTSCPTPRNIVQYIADCFYKEETWEESDQREFLDQAKACVQESCDNLYNPSIGEGVWLMRTLTVMV